MSSELPEKRPPSDVSLEVGGLGLAEGAMEQIRPATVAIAQPTSTNLPKGLTLGHYYVPSTGDDLGPEVMMIPVIHTVQRVFFEKNQQERRPKCVSRDGRRPTSEDFLSPEFAALETDEARAQMRRDHARVELCGACDFAQWRKNPEDPKKNLPPLCSLGNTFLAIFVSQDGKEMRLGSINFKRTSINAGKGILGAIGTIVPRPNLWSRVFNLTTVEIKKPSRRWFEARHAVAGKTADKFPDLVAEAFRIFSASTEVARDAKGETIKDDRGQERRVVKDATAEAMAESATHADVPEDGGETTSFDFGSNAKGGAPPQQF